MTGGFQIGGRGVPSRHGKEYGEGVYSTEQVATARAYVDGQTRLPIQQIIIRSSKLNARSSCADKLTVGPFCASLCSALQVRVLSCVACRPRPRADLLSLHHGRHATERRTCVARKECGANLPDVPAQVRAGGGGRRGFLGTLQPPVSVLRRDLTLKLIGSQAFAMCKKRRW